MRSEVATTLTLDTVRYSQVWEDHELLERSLAIRPDDDVLSIGSSGDNALALLLEGARSVTAIDMSPAQVALIELKVAAIRRLSPEELQRFAGARPGDDRAALYQRLRDLLPESAGAYWDAHPAELAEGFIHCGRLERYFRGFQREHLEQLHPPEAVMAFLDAPDRETQLAAWRRLATPELEEAVRSYFDRDNLANRGRDPAQFRYVPESDLRDTWWPRLRRVATELPTRGNFYLEYFLTSSYRDLARGPRWLRASEHARLRELLDPAARRFNVVTDELERLLTAGAPGAFSKANLSDVFEYMSAEHAGRLFSLLGENLRRGGRLAYWNLLVPRSRPEVLASRLAPLTDPTPREDRVFFYRAFHLEEVR